MRLIKWLGENSMNFFRWLKNKWRRRNYKFIYSEAHGYGVEEKVNDHQKIQWFVGHNNIIESGEFNQA